MPAAIPLDTDEANAYLGDLLARVGREPEARALLVDVLAGSNGHGRALASLGLLEMRAANAGTGVVMLERAAQASPDDPFIQAAFGAALYEDSRRRWDPLTSPAAFERARSVLARAATLDPSTAPTQLALGYAAWATGNLDEATGALSRAVALAPMRHDYRLAYAEALLRRQDLPAAKLELQRLAAEGSEDARRTARALLDVADGRSRAVFDPLLPPRSRGTGVPALRPLKDGERAVIGQFVSLDCSRTFPAYRVATDSGELMLVGAVGGVQLVVFREDGPRSITCGTVPGTPRVRVTYRAVETVAVLDRSDHGTAIAIEFLPEPK